MKNRTALSASNLGSSLCAPALACSVFSLEAKASNNARPDAVAGRIDDGDVETAAGHEKSCPPGHGRCLLVRAATVAHQPQRCAIGTGYGRPEYAGDVAQDEVALEHTVRRCLRCELHG